MSTNKIKPIKVRIRNFQSIKDLEFEICGFTCITGLTNIGKSAIIRSISKALLGSPVIGDIRKGEKSVIVELQSNDWSLKWEKGERGINRYWIPIDSKTPLDKVGQGQIKQISDLGFGSVKIGTDIVHPWLATQFDPVFLMNKSGPAVTDFLSEVSRLGVLQNGITINIKRRRKDIDKAKLRSEDILDLLNKESCFTNLNHVIKVKADLESQIKSIYNYEEKFKNIHRLIIVIEEEAKIIKNIYPCKTLHIPEVLPIQKQINSFNDMSKINMSLKECTNSILKLNNVDKAKIPDINASDNIQIVFKLNHIYNKISHNNKLIDTLSEKITIPEIHEFPVNFSRMCELNNLIKNDKNDETILKNKDMLITDLISINQTELDSIKICPTCFRPM